MIRRTHFTLTLLLLCGSLFWFCQKKLFSKVDIRGRLFDATTALPVQRNVYLRGDDATSKENYSEHSIGLCWTQSEKDGTFRLTSNASKKGKYYLYVESSKGGVPNIKIDNENYFLVVEDQVTNLGDIYVP